MKPLCWLTLSTALCFSEAEASTCSRVINVPVAAIGYSVIVTDNQFSGIFPDLFRLVSQKEQCQFQFSLVPRARMELLFENGQADLLFPAVKTEKRDEAGVFVPLIYTRATLITVSRRAPQVRDFAALLQHKELRIALVRGFDYGSEYRQIIEQLHKKNRVIFEADPISVARVLKAGAAEGTIMAPYIFATVIESDNRVSDLVHHVRYQPLAEITWQDSGIYLSRKSLSEADRLVLQEMMERLAKSGSVWKVYSQYYKDDVMKIGNKPRDFAK